MARQPALPVRVYQSDRRIMVAAPMPGLEPEDISVSIAGDRVRIRGERRGVRQDLRDLLTAEWEIGPYQREVKLPQPVDAALGNATYGNGVLVLALPKLAGDRPTGRAEFQLEPNGPTHGERVGHVGRDLRPTSTAEHRRHSEQQARSAGATRMVHAA